jgi:hypothetical protein
MMSWPWRSDKKPWKPEGVNRPGIFFCPVKILAENAERSRDLLSPPCILPCDNEGLPASPDGTMVNEGGIVSTNKAFKSIVAEELKTRRK